MTLLGVQPVFSMGTSSAPAVDMSLGTRLLVNEAFDSSSTNEKSFLKRVLKLTK
jgi:hypothetical protein